MPEIPENYGQAVVKYEYIDTGEIMTTTFGFHNLPLNVASDNAAFISEAWLEGFTAATTLDSYRYVGVYVLEGIGGVLQSGETADNVDGTVDAEPVSPAVAVGVKKITTYAGKKYRGRMYLPPAVLSEDNVNGAGVIDGATVASLQTKLDNFRNALADLELNMMLLHNDATTPTEVIDLLVRDNVRTQRRRQHLI